MRRRLLPVAVVMLCGASAALVAQGVPRNLLGVGLPADAFFDDALVHEIRLTVNTKDWQSLKDHYLENTYYPCDFRWRGAVVRNAGIRSRGTASRSAVKPGLRVDFDRYTTDQQFLGLKSVVLRNNVEDASNLHERISMLLFRRLGLPAPREAHTALYVNNEYVGLYTIVESIDKSFLNRTFGEQDGYLYEFEHSIDKQYRFEYLGSNPDLYVPVLFKPETHETDPRPEVIERLAWTINETSDAVFRQSIAEYLDLSRFVRHVAVEMFVADNDAILGNWGMNNFYFYRFVNRNLFTFVAWDKSEAFKSGASFSVFHNINDAPMDERNRLMIRALTYPDLYAAYVDALLDCVRSASEPETGAPGGSGWLEREIEREYQQIRAAALIDPLKPFSNDEFEQAVGDLRLFAQQRAAFVLQEVERTRPPSRIRLRTTTRAPQP